jgi:hypothetical protein
MSKHQMRILEAFVTSVVEARRSGVSVGIIHAQLLLQGMNEEEASMLLEVVAVEVRTATPQGEVCDMKVYKVTPEVTKGQIIDMYV